MFIDPVRKTMPITIKPNIIIAAKDRFPNAPQHDVLLLYLPEASSMEAWDFIVRLLLCRFPRSKNCKMQKQTRAMQTQTIPKVFISLQVIEVTD